jgi:hypothetical protein
MRAITILLTILVTLLPIAAFAADADDLKKQIMLDQKKLNVMENLPLSDEEADNFWPIYSEYQEQLFELDVMRSRVLTYYVTNYESLTDQQTINIMDNLFDLADNRQVVMKKFTLELEGALPIRKVFRYLQVENNIAAIEQYSLVQKIPLLQ